MTTEPRSKAITVQDIRGRKGGEPIVCLTAYSTPMARALDAHVDLLLVGDSVGMVIYGMDTTIGVSLEIMIAHGAAVVRGAQQACVIVDMPFGSYHLAFGTFAVLNLVGLFALAWVRPEGAARSG